MKQWNRIFWGIAGAVLFLLPDASAENYKGLIVRDVRISCPIEQELDEELRQQIRLQPGTPFSQEAIQESVRGIYALGYFAQVAVEAELHDGAVRLSLCPERFHILSNIQIRGNKALSSEEIREVIGINSGERLPTHLLSDMQQKIVKLYREQSYHQAHVQLHTRQASNAPEKLILVVDLQEGRPSKIGTTAFYGHNAFSEGELLKISKLKRGTHFTLDALSEAEKRLTRHYAEHGYFSMKVRDRDIQYNYESGETNLNLTIDEGKAAEVSFEGNSELKTKELRKQLELLTPAGIGEELLAENTRTLLEYYRSKGYHFARVQSHYEIVEKAPKVSFLIDEGPQVRVENMTIEGNHSIPAERIRKEMRTKRQRLFSKGLYREALLDEDLLAITALYQQQGFLDVDVSDTREFLRKQSRLALLLSINEGVQTRIEHIDIVGEDNPKAEQQLRKLLPFREGRALNAGQLSKSRDAIRDRYINQGYLNARVEMTTQFTADKSGVSIVYRITPGQQFSIGTIHIQGIERTREGFIVREMLVQEGDLYQPQKIRETTRRLLRTGLYESVTFRRLDLTSREPVQNMSLSVREAAAKRVRVGGGYSTVDEFKLWLEYTDKNVLNLGGKGTIRTELSTTRPKITLQYAQPHFFASKNSLQATLFDELQTDNNSYDIERRGGFLGLKYDFSEKFSASVGGFFEYGDPSNLKEDAILSPLDTSTLDLSGPLVQIRWDSRDDVLLPKKGSSSFVALSSALESFGSETELMQIQAQSKWFFPLFEELVFAFVLTGQAIDPLNDAEFVPIHKRYFLGGDISQNASVRGFKKHEIGPTGEEGSKIGGDRLYAFNTELRFPIYGAFGGVVFYDTGANWLKAEGYDAADLRDAAGAGLRLKTPVGPLRLDYGWKLDIRDGESPGEFIFSIGSAF